MTPADPNPDEPRPAQDAPPPTGLSVDQLTQAFAQLMGDQLETDEPGAPAADAETPVTTPTEAVVPDLVQEDEDDGNVTATAILEALLFVGHPGNEPLTSRQMASYLRGVSPQEVDTLIAELNTQYAQQNTAYHIISVADGYRMTLRDEFLRLRDSFYGRVRQAKLSQTAVDLLAIVAYQQPISREQIDRLRGQASGGTLSQLVRRQLIAVEYTQEKPRQKIYRTTDRFLDLFGLDSLEDLPSQEDF